MTRRNGPPPAEAVEVDEVEVEQVVAGRRPIASAHPSARLAAVRRLTGEGWSAAQIAARIGSSSRTVVRWRSRLAGTS